MNAEQWTIDGFHPLLLALLVIWLIWQTYVAVQDTRALIRHIWLFRQFPVPGRTPKGRVVRHSSQTVRGPAMPDDVTRITGSHWPPPRAEQPTTAFPGPGNPRQPRWGGLLAGLIAMTATLTVVALGGVGYLTYTKLTASSSFQAHGWLVLRGGSDGYSAYSVDGSRCAGVDGYSDIAPGSPVVVRNASGTIVAEGALGDGQIGGSGCQFTVTVSGIPDGGKFYSFEVSHRGQVTMSRAAAAQPRLSLGG